MPDPTPQPVGVTLDITFAMTAEQMSDDLQHSLEYELKNALRALSGKITKFQWSGKDWSAANQAKALAKLEAEKPNPK